MIEFLSQPWPWYVSGPLITLTMFMLLWFGQSFGVSRTLRATCTMLGAGKSSDFFKFDWKEQIWNLVFVTGGLIGGVIASQWIPSLEPVAVTASTLERLQDWGIAPTDAGLAPEAIFSFSGLMTFKGVVMIVMGGFLVGFGTRYANGCTSGHAISGLSNLQLPSLIAVMGFFAGGLLMTHLLLPYLLAL